MKPILRFLSLSAVITASASTLPGQDSNRDLESFVTQEPDIKEFGRFFGGPLYSPTFGLSLWNSPEAVLMEYSYAGEGQLDEQKAENDKKEEKDKKFYDAEKIKAKLLEKARERLQKLGISDFTKHTKEQLAARSLLWVNDYEKLGFNRQFRFKDDQGSAVLLRVRDKFQMLNEESGAATFAYSDDRKASDQGTSFSGALMVDIYDDWLYNRSLDRQPLWVQNPYRFWLRLGYEKDQNSIDKDNEKDFERAYVLLNFQANPDQNATLPLFDSVTISSPQIIQVGAKHERNLITNEESLDWIIGWEPRLLVSQGWLGSKLGRGFALNNRMYYKKGEFATLATGTPEAESGEKSATSADEIIQKRSPLFSFINPLVNIEGSSKSRVNLPDFGNVKDLESLKKLQEEVVTYQIANGLGFDFKPDKNDNTTARWTVSYIFHGVQPLSDLGDGHQWHEFRSEFNLSEKFVTDGSKETTKSNDWAGLTTYVSWVTGEVAPSYTDTDMLTAGISVRF